MGLPVEFYKNVPTEKKDEYEATIRNSTTLLLALRRILTDRLANLHLEEARTSDYDSAAWPFKQANRNGKYTAYQELLAVITFKAKE
jgi:hypothetical protein